jgi:hypothetical protein
MSREQGVEIGGGWAGDDRSRGGLTHHLGGPGEGDSGSASTWGNLLLSLKCGGGHCHFLLLFPFFCFLWPRWHCGNVVEIGARERDYQTLMCRAEPISVG